MRLNQVTVSVRDIDEAASFYRRLGLRLIVRSPHYARFVCPDEGSSFSVHLCEPGTMIHSRPVVYFESERLDDWVAELQAKGIVLVHGPKDQSWLWREARLTDPSGNELCLYHAGENRLHPPWRVRDEEAEGTKPHSA